MLIKLIVILFILYLMYLSLESLLANRYRKMIKHVIYINGTRGKSSVTRLIDAGLRAGGWCTYSKTTGTIPMVIDTNGKENLIKRRGRANIKEQLTILRWAAKEKAEVLVIECMAISPELQYISQHRMLKADIGVITNVRPDHLDVMGETLDEIGESLSNTIPKNGICFTADEVFFPAFKKRCLEMGTRPCFASSNEIKLGIDFPENVAIALEVCRELGVKEEVAIEGMKHYKRDPYALSIYKLSSGALFIGGFAINDPVSTKIVYDRVIKNFDIVHSRLILLISNRLDRGYRTIQHQDLAEELNPDSIWIIGSNAKAMAYRLSKKMQNKPIIILRNASQMPLDSLNSDDIIFAVGNIGESGNLVMERVEEEGMSLCITKLLY